MAVEISAIVTNRWRDKLANIYANESLYGGFSVPTYFKIGEGGWENTPSGKQPKTPNPTLTDITAESYPLSSSYWWRGDLTDLDLSYTSPGRLEVRCIVPSGEANVDNVGNAPEFYELGIFDANDTLLVYTTFPVEIKTDSKTLNHIIYVDF